MPDIGENGYVECAEKFAVIFVIDVSGSMTPHVRALSDNFNAFLDKAKADYKISSKADIEIITFSNEAHASNWSNIAGVPYQDFQAGGMTSMGAAMTLAKEEARSRTNQYASSGVRAYKPWIILMTDGLATDEIDSIAAELRQRELDGKVHVFALGMGDEFAASELNKFTDKCFAIKDWNFETFFSWLGKSVAIVSHSTPGASGPICDTGTECQVMNSAFNGVL